MHIRHRLRKRPQVSGEVFRVVLALAEWMSYRLLCDPSTMFPGSFAVGVGVFDTNRDGMSQA
jgi:hypothetical protein